MGMLSDLGQRNVVGAQTWIVKAVFPTPPSPSTTSLYNVIRPAILWLQ